MDELIKYIEQQLTGHDLELRLNDGSEMFTGPLMNFVKAMRVLLAEYRDVQEMAKVAKTDGKDFGSGYTRGLEDAIRVLATHIWGIGDPDNFKPEWQSSV